MSLNERQRRVDNVSPLEQSVHQEVAHTYIFRASDKIIRLKKNFSNISYVAKLLD